MFNKKIKNKIGFGIILLLTIVVSIIFVSLSSGDFKVVSIMGEQKSIIEEITVSKIENTNLQARPVNLKIENTNLQARPVNLIENFVTLNVLDQSYQIEIKKGDSVYDAMQTLNNLIDSFSFEAKEYPGLGIFINEINGIKGKSGAYWIYYVNEEEAFVGVSQYILKDGDSILWKQE